LRTLGWVGTGVLAAGAITFGVLARKESQDLQAARKVFPTDAKTLNNLSTRTRNLSIVADSLTAGAAVLAAIRLFSTIGAHGESHTGQMVLGPSSIGYHMQF